MRNVLFLMTHAGSDHGSLADHLARDPDINVFRTGQGYDHPDKVAHLTSLPHRRDDAKSVFCDVVVLNSDFTCKAMLGWHRFVYFAREPGLALPALLEERPELATYERAGLHYRFRLRGLAEYSLRTPAAPYVDWRDLTAGRTADLDRYLGRPPGLAGVERGVATADIPQGVLDACDGAYLRYRGVMAGRSRSSPPTSRRR